MKQAADFTVYERGALWYVQWCTNGGVRHWKTTGVRVQPDRKGRGRGAAMIAAAKIAGERPKVRSPILAEYARDFYRCQDYWRW